MTNALLLIFRSIQFNRIGDIQMVSVAVIVQCTNRKFITEASINVIFLEIALQMKGSSLVEG
jgi:hypothetical protein